MIALAVAAAAIRIGIIDFYGYGGLDVEKLRAALPIHAGDPFSPESPDLKPAIEKALGRSRSEVEFVCCDPNGDAIVFIRVDGATAHVIAYDPPPHGNARVPPAVLRAYEQCMDLLEEAVKRGAAGEDDSRGYALFEYPPLRARQLKLRDLALRHERELHDALASAADAAQRAAAAYALGYAQRSPAQMAALVRAVRDPDSGVRNNATRALGVLAAHDPRTARRIPAAPFIEMLWSLTWSDRNKAGMVLLALTAARDAKVLAELRERTVEPLFEMAQWQSEGHARAARVLLGRIAGIDEKRAWDLTAKDLPAVRAAIGRR